MFAVTISQESSMDPALRIVLLAFGITGGIGLLIYLRIAYRDKKRTAALTTVAQSLGFMFLGEEWNGSALEPQQMLFENSVVFEHG
jgi:predicted MFS family arabinose efflux permease